MIGARRIVAAALVVTAALAAASGAAWAQEGTEASGDTPDLYIDVAGLSGCTTNRQPPPLVGDAQCNVAQGAQFAVRAFVGGFDGLPDLNGDGSGRYAGAQFRLVYSAGLTRIDHLGDTEFGPPGAPYWPDCVFRTELPESGGAHLLVCLVNGLVGSTHTGQILEVGFVCSGSGRQTVTLDEAQSYLHDEAHQPGTEKDGDEVLTIICGAAASDGGDGSNGGGGPADGGEDGGQDGGGDATLPTAGGAPASDSGPGVGMLAAIVAGAAGALVALGGGVWALRRRRS